MFREDEIIRFNSDNGKVMLDLTNAPVDSVGTKKVIVINKVARSNKLLGSTSANEILISENLITSSNWILADSFSN